MKSAKSIAESVRKHKGELAREFKVSKLGIFGSYVRGEQKKGSDVDILVAFTEPPSLFGFVELQERLSSIVGGKVDLVMESSLKPNIGRRILREAVLI